MHRAMRPCPVPGCPQLTDRAKGCVLHRHDRTAAFYDGVWQAFARAYLARHPVCEQCRRRPAREVHHVKSLAAAPRRRLDQTNVRALCHDCHRALTPTVRADGGIVRRKWV